MTDPNQSAARFVPRRMEVDRLVAVLVEEHRVMREGLQKAKGAAASGDFDGVGRALREVGPVFRQHIADEEAQVLGLLIARLGVKGAEAEIVVFRQHRPIYELMKRVSELAAMSSTELESSRSELDRLFEEHTALEESQVFPRAVSLQKGGSKGADD